MTSYASGHPSRALVIGGSFAGLMTARVLADHFDEVLVLDRDDLPEGPVSRDGVPHGRHTHGLLARGREILEGLFPGLSEDLVARGALMGDIAARSSYNLDGMRLARTTSDMVALVASRPLLEGYLRGRVTALPRVRVVPRTSVLDLAWCATGERVVGAQVADREDPTAVRTVYADLVVDVSGRGSRTPEWLTRGGYPAPLEERVRVDICYATRHFRRRAGRDDDLAVLAGRSPVNTHGAVLLAQEGDRWIVSITGVHGERPPTDLAGFRAYARSCPSTAVADIIDECEPLDEALTYRFPADLRRRYERLRRRPGRLLVLGDALCSFNPVFGQGLTVAALQVEALSAALDQGLDGLERRFFRAASRTLETPWRFTVGQDITLPGSTEPVPVGTRLTNRYMRRLVAAAVDDPELARTFLRVNHLVAGPGLLFAPRTIARVLRAGRRDAAARPARVTARRGLT